MKNIKGEFAPYFRGFLALFALSNCQKRDPGCHCIFDSAISCSSFFLDLILHGFYDKFKTGSHKISNSNISVLVELAQPISCCGLFEINDVIHNVLENAVGVLLVLGLRRVMKQ